MTINSVTFLVFFIIDHLYAHHCNQPPFTYDVFIVAALIVNQKDSHYTNALLL